MHRVHSALCRLFPQGGGAGRVCVCFSQWDDMEKINKNIKKNGRKDIELANRIVLSNW